MPQEKDQPLVGVHVRVPEKLRQRFHMACIREKLNVTKVIEMYMKKFADWSEAKERGEAKS